MIRVYAVDCTPYLRDDTVTRALPHLDDVRRKRVARLRLPLKRAQCVAAGLLLTRLLGKDGVAPHLAYSEHGKPSLAEDNAFCFSLSHTDRWVFCAVSTHAVGLDAQVERAVSPRLMSRTLSAQEANWVSEETVPRFIRLWTMKETYLKYTGTGLSVPLRTVEIAVPPAPHWDEQNKVYWHFPAFDDGISVTVCGEEPECDAIQVITL